jgi:cytoskeletal protein RodZ
LKALESDDYSIMPSAAQGRGFLRNYSEFLELDLDAELADLQKNPPEPSELSGPLSNADIIPEEQPAIAKESASRPFWARFLPHRPNGESAPEVEAPTVLMPATESQTQVEPPEPPKRRGRKKTVENTSDQPAHKGRKRKLTESSPAILEEIPARDVEETSLENEQSLNGGGQVNDDALSRATTEGIVAPESIVQDETESSPVAGEQVKESKPGLLQKALSLFKRRTGNNSAEPRGETAPEAEPKVILQPEMPVSAPVASETAEEIFVAIGRELQARRELISLTFDEVERHTHVRALFLKQMEEGAFDKLPSPVQTRGMLANYTTFLDLDADTILLRYAEALQARHRQKYPERLRSKSPLEPTPSIPPLRSFIAGDVIFGVTMVVILIALAIWGVGKVLDTQRPELAALPTAPSISDVLAGTPVPTIVQEVTFVPVDDAPVVTAQEESTLEVPTLPANISVQVIVAAVERAFVRVSVDGETVYDGRVTPGEEFTFEAENQVSILTGNAAALRVIYNGRDLGLMGNFGEVVSQIYTGAGLATPTATLPPTATPTPLESITPSQTGTSTQTTTPTPAVVTPTP